MTNVVIILCGLILAFSDKPHLFHKPVKWWKVILLIVILGAAIMNFIKGHADDIREQHDTKTIDSLQSASKIQLQLIDTLRRENKAAQFDFHNTLSEYFTATSKMFGLSRAEMKRALDSIRYNQETPKGTKQVAPILDIPETPVITTTDSRKTITIKFYSYNSDSYPIGANMLVLRTQYLGGNEYMFQNSRRVAEITLPDIIPANGVRTFTMDVTAILNYGFVAYNQFFMVLDCYYKSNKNIEQSPLRRYLLLLRDGDNVQVIEADAKRKKQIHQYLIKIGVWKT